MKNEQVMIRLLLIAIAFSSNVVAEPFRIGMLLPLSGQYSAVGVDTQQGIEVAKLEISHPERLEFRFYDSKAEPAQAVSEFRKLLNVDHAHGAFVFRGPPGMAVNPISNAAQLPLLGGVGNKDFAARNLYAFQLWPRSDYEGEFLAVQLRNKGIQRVAVYTVQDDWPVAVSDSFKKKFKELGGVITVEQDALPIETDFRASLNKLRSSLVDAVFMNLGLTQIAPFTNQLRELEIKTKLYSNFWAGKSEVVQAIRAAAESEIVFPEMTTNLAPLKEVLKNKFGSSPSGATVSAYVATILLSQAVSEIEPSSDTSKQTEKLYQSLLKQKVVNTPNGTFEVTDRLVHFPMTLRKVTNGSVEDVL